MRKLLKIGSIILTIIIFCIINIIALLFMLVNNTGIRYDDIYFIMISNAICVIILIIISMCA